MALHQIATVSVVYGLFKVPRIRRRSCAYILSMFLLLVRPNSSSSSSFYDLNLWQDIVFIYRIITIQYKETSLTATGPGTLTSKGAKAAFYVLQSAIELLVVAFLLVSPMRRLYGVGRWGDPPNDHLLNKQLIKEERLASTTQLKPEDHEEVRSS